MIRALHIVVIGLALSACGAKSGEGSSTTPAAGMTGASAPAAALAAQLGINEAYVTAAWNAAQSALGTSPEKTPEAKAQAAQAGVDSAATQAQADGKPLAEEQKSGLLEGLKGLL